MKTPSTADTATTGCSGGAGDDRLTGGSGTDILVGGAGADRFVFSAATDAPPGAGRDVIRDFETFADVVDVSRIDANVGLAGDQAFVFIGSVTFSGRACELRFATGALQGDVDGDGRADYDLVIAGTTTIGPSNPDL